MCRLKNPYDWFSFLKDTCTDQFTVSAAFQKERMTKRLEACTRASLDNNRYTHSDNLATYNY